jgi:hypothetical protein
MLEKQVWSFCEVSRVPSTSACTPAQTTTRDDALMSSQVAGPRLGGGTTVRVIASAPRNIRDEVRFPLKIVKI